MNDMNFLRFTQTLPRHSWSSTPYRDKDNLTTVFLTFITPLNGVISPYNMTGRVPPCISIINPYLLGWWTSNFLEILDSQLEMIDHGRYSSWTESDYITGLERWTNPVIWWNSWFSSYKSTGYEKFVTQQLYWVSTEYRNFRDFHRNVLLSPHHDQS